MIPKRIYNIWLGDNPMPENRKKFIDNWKKINPDYEVITVSEKDVDIKKYPFIMSAVKYKKWAFASDMLRLVLIYENGGFYLDNDVELLKPLNSLEKFKSVWALENSDAINPGLIIGAEYKDKDIEEILNVYNKMIYVPGDDDKYITVPIVTEHFLKKGFKIINKTQVLNNNNILILASKYFAPLHWWGGGKVNEETIGIHHYDASWKKDWHVSWKTKLFQETLLINPRLGLILKKIKSRKK